MVTNYNSTVNDEVNLNYRKVAYSQIVYLEMVILDKAFIREVYRELNSIGIDNVNLVENINHLVYMSSFSNNNDDRMAFNVQTIGF